MYCAFCGGANPADADVCVHCAKPIAGASSGASADQPDVRSQAPTLNYVPVANYPGDAQAVGPYTCVVCGYVLGPADSVCTRCKTPRGMQVDPQSAVPGAFAPTSALYAEQNTSGMKSTVPAEIAGGWNWGAFWFTWIWGLNHRAYVTLYALLLGVLGVLPGIGALFNIASLGFQIYCGVKGNSWAWQNRRFDSIAHFRTVQRIWAYWALGFFVAVLLLVVLAVIVPLMMMGTRGLE